TGSSGRLITSSSWISRNSARFRAVCSSACDYSSDDDEDAAGDHQIHRFLSADGGLLPAPARRLPARLCLRAGGARVALLHLPQLGGSDGVAAGDENHRARRAAATAVLYGVKSPELRGRDRLRLAARLRLRGQE